MKPVCSATYNEIFTLNGAIWISQM